MRLPDAITPLAEQVLRDGREWRVEVELAGARVPAVLLVPGTSAADVPASARGALGVPAAVLLHGYASRKELMVDTVGHALLRRGIASLALDLPLHGDREGPLQEQARFNPLQLMRQWRLALAETTAAVRLLGDVPGVDRGRLALVGYSMGAYLAVMAAAEEPAARAVVLAAGGDLPDRTPLAHLVRRVADPLRAVQRFQGRPLLMLHGRHDRTVLPAQAQRLFDAAGEPKTLRWLESGHYLPPDAVDDAARWLAEALAGGVADAPAAALGAHERDG